MNFLNFGKIHVGEVAIAKGAESFRHVRGSRAIEDRAQPDRVSNHPVMIRGLARIAKLLGTVAPPKSNKEKTIAEILYPNDS